MCPHGVVVVEDDPEVLDLEVFLLESEGYHVTPVRNGLEAVRVIRENQPEVVLLDVTLPGLDGNQILRALADAQLAPRVIVVSAYTSRLDDGPLVRRVLGKPFEVSALLDAVADECAAALDERAL